MAERVPTYLDFASGAIVEFASTDTIAPSRIVSAYPVNSVVMNTDNVNPGLQLGGTWSALGTATVGVTTIYYFKRTA